MVLVVVWCYGGCSSSVASSSCSSNVVVSSLLGTAALNECEDAPAYTASAGYTPATASMYTVVKYYCY